MLVLRLPGRLAVGLLVPEGPDTRGTAPHRRLPPLEPWELPGWPGAEPADAGRRPGEASGAERRRS